MANARTKLTVFIATPLEQEHVDALRAVAPDDIDVLYEPDLLPPTLYVADHKGDEAFERSPEQEQRWQENLARADVLWDFPPRAFDGTGGLAYAPRVKWIQGTSTGVGRTVERLGLVGTDVLVTTARGVHAGPLAEFAMLTLLSHAKHQRYMQEESHHRRWERFCSDDLEGRTLAIVGVGSIGLRVAAVGRAFGMRVVALARPGSDHTAEELGVDELFSSERLHEMLAETDALVLAVPDTPDTAGLMDRAAFAALKPGAVFVNVARGQVVDEVALIDALRTEQVAFAGLDVFAVEPLPAESPLWELPNVIISPHSASTVASENRKITEIFSHNLRCYVEGREGDMMNVLDKARLY
ncbi:MAG TPA: D-2-hydroxyacid dehydrogenase [Dehalococcoidia bacterium]|nr:D-2-hydroxyacid dehydrogenase [Dehalococcoidia bacterium]